MKKLSRLFLPFLFILIQGKQSHAIIDSVVVSFHEEANASSGPWQLIAQEIDSINEIGQVQSELRRVYTGSNWLNDRSVKYTYNSNGAQEEIVSSIWDGVMFMENSKVEKTYDQYNKLATEILFEYNQNSWVAVTKTEYAYTLALDVCIATSFLHTGGSWIYTDQYTREYNSNQKLTSELRKSWSGSSWDEVSLLKKNYNIAGNQILNDSVFMYASNIFLLTQATQYTYTISGSVESKIRREFYSSIYSDPDTEYVESEVIFEYTTNNVFNQHGLMTEQHAQQTEGSSHNWLFENNFFQYNSEGLLSNEYRHAGSNLTEVHRNTSTYYYALLNAEFSPTGVTCTGCLNGSVDINISGGIPPYQIEISSGSGTINGYSVEDLTAGLYTICVSDSIGNESCREINIQDVQTGINSSGRLQSLLTVSKVSVGFLIDNKSSETTTFSVFDTNGRLLMEKLIPSGKSTFSTEHLPAGLYFYKAQNQKITVSGRALQMSN
ncbi:MAG: T9SS type A sorting domain-containing protein [Bacteroidia bacterium]|nr:T9SS type A sorting domain-containing protein [Bacteroidia bacterium]